MNIFLSVTTSFETLLTTDSAPDTLTSTGSITGVEAKYPTLGLILILDVTGIVFSTISSIFIEILKVFVFLILIVIG